MWAGGGEGVLGGVVEICLDLLDAISERFVVVDEFSNGVGQACQGRGDAGFNCLVDFGVDFGVKLVFKDARQFRGNVVSVEGWGGVGDSGDGRGFVVGRSGDAGLFGVSFLGKCGVFLGI